MSASAMRSEMTRTSTSMPDPTRYLHLATARCARSGAARNRNVRRQLRFRPAARLGVTQSATDSGPRANAPSLIDHDRCTEAMGWALGVGVAG